MTRFLRLSKTLINTSQIVDVTIHPDEYRIYYNAIAHNGFQIFSCGILSSSVARQDVCKLTEPDDYEKVTKWIDSCNV